MRYANSNLPPRHLLEALRQPRRPQLHDEQVRDIFRRWKLRGEPIEYADLSEVAVIVAPRDQLDAAARRRIIALRHGVPGLLQPLPAVVGPRLEAFASWIARIRALLGSRALGLCCRLVGAGNGLGIPLGGALQFDPLSNCLSVPICLISGAAGTLDGGGDDEAQRWDHCHP